MLHTHEIFAPENTHKKKIVILGASTADSVGCDYTWSLPTEKKVPRNVHFSCSIAGQLNKLLKEAKLDDWQAFNLARNGAKLTPMLYTYATIRELEPELVIYGDLYAYYAKDGAGANDLDATQLAMLDETLGGTPETQAVWSAYKNNLHRTKPAAEPVARQPPPPIYRATTSLQDILLRGLSQVDHLSPDAAPPYRIAYNYNNENLESEAVFDFAITDKSDPGMVFLEGFSLINALQEEQGNKFFLYFGSAYQYRNDTNLIRTLREGAVGQKLDSMSVPFEVYVDLPLKPIYETYDGVHQTRDGNAVIARKLLDDLLARRIIE